MRATHATPPLHTHAEARQESGMKMRIEGRKLAISRKELSTISRKKLLAISRRDISVAFLVVFYGPFQGFSVMTKEFSSHTTGGNHS